MYVKIALLLPLTLMANMSCTSSKHDISEGLRQHNLHWGYSGETSPEHWIDIEKDSDCGGRYQSPINIIHNNAKRTKNHNELNIQYAPNTLISKVENNGHSIQFDFEAGDSINYHNEIYHLKQIHFHEPSEHRINGIIYPIEMHLVHVSKTGSISVLGLLGEEGDESQLFEFFESFLPIKEGMIKDIHQKIDLSSLFLEDKPYYSYKGSLTTPPCTENVNWIVFKEPIILSVEEVLKLKNNMPINNYRNEQPLNDRVVTYHF